MYYFITLVIALPVLLFVPTTTACMFWNDWVAPTYNIAQIPYWIMFAARIALYPFTVDEPAKDSTPDESASRLWAKVWVALTAYVIVWFILN